MELTPAAETVEQTRSELTDAEAIDTVLAAFDSRLEELQWRQDETGVLYVGDGPQPSMLARVELQAEGECNAAIADAADVDVEWSKLERVPMTGQEAESRVQD